MSRRQLECALVAGSLMETELSPSFRFTRVRFARHYYPPGYECYQSGPTQTVKVRHTDSHKSHNYNNSTNNNNQINSGGDDCQTGCQCNEPVKNPFAKFYEPGMFERDGDGLPLRECPDPDKFAACQNKTNEFEERYPWRVLGDDFGVHCVQFSPDGRDLLAGSANTSIRVIHTTDGTQRLLPRPSKWTLGMPITAMRYLPTKFVHVIACNSHGEIFTFIPNKEGFETIMKEPQQTFTLDVSPDGKELATGGDDRKVRIYRLNPASVVGMPFELKDVTGGGSGGDHLTDQCECRNSIASFTSAVKDKTDPAGPKHTRLAFPGGRPDRIVDKTTKSHAQASCFSLRQSGHAGLGMCQPIGFQRGHIASLQGYVATAPEINLTQGHSRRIMALKYHPDRPNLLFSAGWDNLVKIWDTRLHTGPVGQIYGPHVASPDGLDIDDNYLLTASWRATRSLELWDFRKISPKLAKVEAKPAGSQVAEQMRKAFNEQQQKQQQRMSDTLNRSTTLAAAVVKPDTSDAISSNTTARSSITGIGTQLTYEIVSEPVQVIPLTGATRWESKTAEADRGEYLYAACLLGQHAVAAAGSGFNEVRVVSRDTLMPIAQIPVDSVVQSMDSVLGGRYLGCGCSSGTVTLIGLA